MQNSTLPKGLRKCTRGAARAVPNYSSDSSTQNGARRTRERIGKCTLQLKTIQRKANETDVRSQPVYRTQTCNKFDKLKCIESLLDKASELQEELNGVVLDDLSEDLSEDSSGQSVKVLHQRKRLGGGGGASPKNTKKGIFSCLQKNNSLENADGEMDLRKKIDDLQKELELLRTNSAARDTVSLMRTMDELKCTLLNSKLETQEPEPSTCTVEVNEEPVIESSSQCLHEDTTSGVSTVEENCETTGTQTSAHANVVGEQITGITQAQSPTDVFLTILTDPSRPDMYKVTVSERGNGQPLGIFYIDEDAFQSAYADGTFDQYLSLFVLTHADGPTDSGRAQLLLNTFVLVSK